MLGIPSGRSRRARCATMSGSCWRAARCGWSSARSIRTTSSPRWSRPRKARATCRSCSARCAAATRDNRIPLFSLDITTVERGAIASYSNNQYQTGVEWALDVAAPVLLGRDAGTILATPYRAFDLYINTASAAAVGITLPPALVERAARRFDR